MKTQSRASNPKVPAGHQVAIFGALPTTGYVRLAQLHGNPKRGIPGILPWSPATTWRRVRAGTFPAPIKLSEKVTAWRAEAIRQFLDEQGQAA